MGVPEFEQMTGRPVDTLLCHARDGDGAAAMMMGLYYISTPMRDAWQARHWFEQAMRRGTHTAAFYLGMMYYDGDGAVRDTRRGVSLLCQAAEEGFVPAMTALASHYLSEAETTRHTDSLYYWASRSAEGGDSLGMEIRGLCHMKGMGVRRDSVEGAQWIYRSVHAGNGHAMVLWAWMLSSGYAVRADQDEALRWALRADSLGVEGAHELVGTIEEHRRYDARFAPYGLTYKEYLALPDEKSVALTLRMAQAGDAEAQYDMGSFYYGGHHGVKKDYRKSRYWYRKSAEGGYEHARETLNELGW